MPGKPRASGEHDDRRERPFSIRPREVAEQTRRLRPLRYVEKLDQRTRLRGPDPQPQAEPDAKEQRVEP